MATVPKGKPRPRTYEQFVVKDEVWASAGMPPGKVNPKTYEMVGGGFLCVGCIEKRLGRRLTMDDINPITIPTLFRSPWITERLRSRILYPDQASEDAAKLEPDPLRQARAFLTEEGLAWYVGVPDIETDTAAPYSDEEEAA
jgi:hypothetical protein